MIRAKFTCQQNTLNHETQISTVTLSPVTTNPPSEENLSFWKNTPSGAMPAAGGAIALGITNPQASAQFTPGADYYVDFTPVT